MKKIGFGRFSDIYHNGDHVIAIVIEQDYTKQALSQVVKMPHVPDVSKLAENKFKMPLYRSLSDANKPMVDFLITSWQNFANRNPVPLDGNPVNFYNRVIEYLQYIKNIIDVSLYNALEIIVETMKNFTMKINMDFHLDNFMEDDDGDIILLDVIWSPSVK